MSTDKSLKEHVEEQIIKYTFKAKDFSKEEMDSVDDYCKIVYGNNRKLMIMDLIRYKEENTIANLLNEKIENVIEYFDERLGKLENKDNVNKEEKPKKEWKGFSRE